VVERFCAVEPYLPDNLSLKSRGEACSTPAAWSSRESDIEDIVENLTSKLYFHGHPINRTEADKELRPKIVWNVPAEVESTIWLLYTDFEAEFRNREPFEPFVDLAKSLQPWALPAGTTPPVPQIAHQTRESPLAIVESGIASSVQKVKNASV
jgi:hypothetical protein